MSVPQNPIVPQCKAILLCDQAFIDEGTQRITLSGILTGFKLSEFPGHTQEFTVFVQVTDGYGRYELIVEIHDLTRGVLHAKTPPIPLEIDDRLDTTNIIVPLPGIPLEQPGTYDVVVMADGLEIDRQPFRAELIEGEMT